MKVSSKIILGFMVLMALAVIVVGNQLQTIHQMQAVNHDLSEINLKSATIVVDIQKLAGLLDEDSQKYFALNEPPLLYEQQIADFRSDFLDDVAQLQKNAKSERE